MILSKRLLAIADYIDEKDKVVDVGCDHGYLDIYLALHKKNKLIIASDISTNVIKGTKENLKNYGVEDKIKVYCTNGLENIKENYDTIVLSGLGAHTILEVLKNNIKANKIIIQSNNNWEFIRTIMYKLGYFLQSEKLVYEHKKLYSIMLFNRTKKRLKKIERKIGIYLPENVLEYKIWLDLTKNILQSIPKKYFLKRRKYVKQIKFLNKYLCKENRTLV